MGAVGGQAQWMLLAICIMAPHHGPQRHQAPVVWWCASSGGAEGAGHAGTESQHGARPFCLPLSLNCSEMEQFWNQGVWPHPRQEGSPPGFLTQKLRGVWLLAALPCHGSGKIAQASAERSHTPLASEADEPRRLSASHSCCLAKIT